MELFADIYHTTFDWPTSSEVANRLDMVAGNSEENVVNRLVDYHRHIEGIMTSFKSGHKVINADQPKADVFSQGRLKIVFAMKQPMSWDVASGSFVYRNVSFFAKRST